MFATPVRPRRRMFGALALAFATAGSIVVLAPAAPVSAVDPPPCSTRSANEGSAYTVPAGVRKVRVTAWGEAGETGQQAGGNKRLGGAGSKVVADVPVTIGDQLQPIRIDGGAAGLAGRPKPRDPGSYDQTWWAFAGTHGGSARGVVRVRPGCREVLVVAGGGGGNGSEGDARGINDPKILGWSRGMSSSGGAAGLGPSQPAGAGQAGYNGRNDTEDGAGGAGATLTLGGGGGARGQDPGSFCADGINGGNGGFELPGAGGAGWNEDDCQPRNGGGGGGAGYYGGGGGGSHQDNNSGSGAGGGGSSYVIAGASNVSYAAQAAMGVPVTTIEPIYDAPGAPTNVFGVPQNHSVDVSFTAPTTFTPIASYTIRSTPGGFTTSVPAGGTLTGRVTGLTNGTSYQFSVVAVPTAGVLLDGTPTPSPLTSGVTPRPEVPTAVRNLTATPGDGKVTLTFDPPADDGGAAITQYLVTYSTIDGAEQQLSPTSPIVAGSGLTNGQPTTFTVVAYSAAGTGAPATVVGTPTSVGVPVKPGKPTAVPLNGSARVTVPTAEPGYNAFFITTTPAPSCGAPTTAFDGPGYRAGDPVSFRVRCLDNGTAYRFSVAARNDSGLGEASDQSDPVTPRPTVPESLDATLTAGIDSADVVITGVDDGGSPITSYTAWTDDQVTFQTISTTVAVLPGQPPGPITLTGLAPGRRYVVYVGTTNAVGRLDQDRNLGGVYAHTVPNAPTAVTATVPSDGVGRRIDVAFTTSQLGPCGTYEVTAMPGSITKTGAVSVLDVCSGQQDHVVTFDNLTNQTPYTFSVRVVDDLAGPGPESESLNPVAPYASNVPDAPSDLTATGGGSGKARLSWVAPPDDWKWPVTSYQITWPGGSTVVAAPATGVLIDGLTNDAAYEFTVAAVNEIGTGPDVRSNGITPIALSTPTGVAIQSGNAAASLSFDPVADGGGGEITYVVTAIARGFPDDEIVVEASEPPVLLAGLTNGRVYDVTVHASNDEGVTPDSAPVAADPLAERPTAPANVTATAEIGRATISFDLATVRSGIDLLTYTVTSHPESHQVTVPADDFGTGRLSATLAGLTNGVTYRFTVHATAQAFSGGGQGLESALSNAVTPDRLTQAALTVTPVSGVNGHQLPLTAAGGSGTGDLGDFATSGTACMLNPDGTAVVFLHATTTDRTCTISITKDGDDDYRPITVEQVVTIAPAPLTVTARNQDLTYGDDLDPATVSYHGFVSPDDPSSLDGTLTFSGSAVTSPGAGQRALTPGGLSSSDYDITFVDGTVTFDRRPAVIQVHAVHKVYGEPNPTFEADVEGLVADDELDFDLTSVATDLSRPGTYPLLVELGDNPDYDVSIQDNDVHVVGAPLTIRANDASAQYGDPVTFNGVTTTGLVGSDTLGMFFGDLTYSVEGRTGPHPADTFDIMPDGLWSPWYDITYERGTLTRTRRSSELYWGNPFPIYYGAALSGNELDASAGPVGTFTYSPALGTVLHAGTHEITVDFVPDDDAYAPASQTVEIVVVKAPLTVTTRSTSRRYGDANPAFSVDYGPFRNGDGSGSLGGSLAFTTLAGPTSPVGDYPVAPSGLTAADYQITFVAGSLSITKASTSVTWSDPDPIVYGTALTGTQLNASAGGVPGTFTYSPPLGTELHAGADQALEVTFTPTSTTNYEPSTKTVHLDVAKAPLTVTAQDATKVYGEDNPAFGAGYSGFENDDTSASLTGTLALDTDADQDSPAGDYPIEASGLASSDYEVTFLDGTLTVAKAPTSVTWSDPDPIGYGTALSADQLNASAGVPGSFTYSPESGTVLHAGADQAIEVTFTPTDPANHEPSTKTVDLDVTKAPLTVTAQNATKVYLEANPAFEADHSDFENGDTLASLSGTLALDTEAVASSAVGEYPIEASGLSSSDYEVTFVDGTLSVTKATTSVTWSDPDPIGYGTLLSVDQLNATGSVPGEISYSPPSGTLLDAGADQVLKATFTPTDMTNYRSSSKTVHLDVTKAPTSITWADPDPIEYGTALSDDQLDASAGVPGSFTYSPASGTVLHAGADQELEVTFTPTDTANHEPSTETVHLDVTKAPLTVTAQDATKVYLAANPAFEVDYSDFQNDDTATALTGAPAFTTTADEETPVGDYPIEASGLSSSDYEITFADGTLSVTKAATSATWSDPDPIEYGTALTGAQLDATAGVPGSFTYSPTLGTVLHAGADQTLEVTFTPTDTANYRPSTATAHVDVARAPLTVTAVSDSRAYGQPNPEFTVTYGPFRNGETAASLSGHLSVSTLAVASSPVGEYPIAPSGLTSSDYTITFLVGTLRVTEAATSVTWSDPSPIVYGTALSAAQLNASVGVPGTFTYEPALGTVLHSASDQVLRVTFEPDGRNHQPSTATVQIDVTRAPLTVTADDARRSFGAANPGFSVTYGQFRNGDGVAALTGQVVVSTDATNASGVGRYGLVPSGLTSSDYDLTFVTGTLRVVKSQVVLDGRDAALAATKKARPIKFSGLVTSATTGAPLAGVDVTFAVRRLNGGTVGCTATTGPAGVARCATRAISRTRLRADPSYAVRSAPTPDLAPGQGRGTLLARLG